MEARFLVLHLALNELGVAAENGHAVQKAVYLAQAAGAPMGYRFAWYARGPHSGALAGNIYLMEMALEVRTKTPLVKSDWSGGTEVARINDPLCPARMALHQVVEMTAREKWEGR